MATAQLIAGRGGLPTEVGNAAVSRPEAARRVPLLIGAALLLLVLYAAFDHGAVALSVDTRIEVAVAAIAVVAVAAWLGSGTLRLAAPRTAWVGVALLALFRLLGSLPRPSIAFQQGQLMRACDYLEQAVERNPTDIWLGRSWARLTRPCARRRRQAGGAAVSGPRPTRTRRPGDPSAEMTRYGA